MPQTFRVPILGSDGRLPDRYAPQLVVNSSGANYAPRVGSMYTPTISTSGQAVTVQFSDNVATLPWNLTSGGIITEFANLTNQQRDAYFSIPTQISTWWASNPAVDPAWSTYVPTPYRFGITISGGTRLLLAGNMATGRDAPPLIYINGELTSLNIVNPSNAYSGYKAGILITLPTNDEVTVEVQSSFSIMQFAVDSTATTWPYRSPAPLIGVVGDSWTEGNEQGGRLAFPAIVQAMTGWRIAGSTQGGTGYTFIATGSKSPYGDASRAPGIVSAGVDLLVVFGSINDASAPAGAVQAAASELIAATGTTPVILMGPQLPGSQNLARNFTELQNAAAGHSNVLAVIDTSSWGIQTGPSDYVHPSPVGVRQLANRFVNAVRTTMLSAGYTTY